MRIIGGKYKGKKLSQPLDKTTRPLKDLVKESIFNIIQHSKKINIQLENSKVLDLYAGSGSFGLECISRDAELVYFFEKHSNAVKILNKNLKILNKELNYEIYNKDCLTFIASENFIEKNFDIIFLDPPFAENFFINDLKNIKKLKIINRNHLVVIHREKKSEDDLNEVLTILLSKNYGRSKILFGKLT